jgi:hypothetical protein
MKVSQRTVNITGDILMKVSGSCLSARCAVIVCAALAIFLTNAVLFAQALGGLNPKVAIDSPASIMPPDASGRETVVNTLFTYPDIELWDASKWKGNSAKATPIATWVRVHQKDTNAEYVINDRYKEIKDLVGNPDYNWKADSIRDPDIVDPLVHMGLRVEIREGGGFEIFVAPERVLTDKAHRVPILYVPYVLDKKDVFWAMNALVHFKKYNELCAQRGDFMIIYVVDEKSPTGRGSTFSNVVGKAYDEFQGDRNRAYLDVSVFKENNAKIADVPGLDWSLDDGTKRDPDAAIEHIGFIPSLNITGKTAGKPSPGIGVARGRNDSIHFTPQLIVHGLLGEHWMEGISFAYNHGKNDEPATQSHFEKMGLVGGEHEYKGRRYFLFSPQPAMKQNMKLPLVVVNTEVAYDDDYSLTSAYAEYLDYFKLAAKGDINLLILSLRTQESRDNTYELIKELEKTSPIDPSRIYVTGHSHAGHETREFAYQHPDMVAAAAPLGNSAGLAAPAYSHETILADDERIGAWSNIDMPLITIGAAGEVLSPHTMPSLILPDYDLFVDAWQRRLKASHAPMKTREEIMAAEHSPDYVTRLFGLPNDGSSLQVIDGVEHYIIDVKNLDGRDHLRLVGIQNMIHTPEPTMPMVAWTFMRRFARDQKTGKVIELY